MHATTGALLKGRALIYVIEYTAFMIKLPMLLSHSELIYSDLDYTSLHTISISCVTDHDSLLQNYTNLSSLTATILSMSYICLLCELASLLMVFHATGGTITGQDYEGIHE